jgi:hypothetical protein
MTLAVGLLALSHCVLFRGQQIIGLTWAFIALNIPDLEQLSVWFVVLLVVELLGVLM